MKFIFFLLIFCSCADAYDVKIRDSQTGHSIQAQVVVKALNQEKLSKSQWRSIRLGQHMTDVKSLITTKKVTPQNHKYRIDEAANLQLLEISADNYTNKYTYIEATQKVRLTDIFLDSSQTKSTSCQGLQICGYLYDKDNVQPLAAVQLELSNNHYRYFTQTDKHGFFKFSQKIPENATLVASHVGYRTQIWNAISLKSAFLMIIDLQKGSGMTEHSMRHPLMDVRDNKVDPKWLQTKVSQTASLDTPEVLERPGGGFYIEPPANIRVGFNASGGTCCGSNCATSQVYSLESYVQKGLDNEWISSWNAESLKAGSIPYRSYGAWHVLHTPYSGYDICAGPCCQAFNSISYTATVNAAKATTGIMLEKTGLLARSEYSAQNNSWNDPIDGLACTNTDLSCLNGSVGSPAKGWPCLSDPTSTNKGCFGHGRGMSQWGTQFNALTGKDFADIVDFYYNANNNPSGQRSQYNTSPIRIDGITPSLNTVSPNQSLSLNFQIHNANSSNESFGPIILGASLINTNAVYSDSPNDAVFTITQNGTNNLSRAFTIPSNAQSGIYDLVTAVYLDVNRDNIITAADWALVSLRLTNQIIITTLSDLMFSDSFE